MADLKASLRKPFPEQIAAFRLRLGNLVPTATWTDIWQDQHDRSFMVAGAMKADLLADLGAAVDKAIAEGTGLQAFRKDFRKIVERNGWTGWTGEGSKKGEAWRTRVIYRTNMATSYAAGRMAQLVKAGYPLWVYHHGASLEPREQHLSWDGLVLSVEHPFWATHAPPNGWGCSCYISGARSEAMARRLGGDPDKKLADGWQARDPKTGAPVGIDKGWSYAPGRSVAETVHALSDKLPKLPASIGAAMFHLWPGRTQRLIRQEFEAFVDKSLSSRVEKNYMIIGALKPKWVAEAAAHQVDIETAEIAVTDLNVQHSFRGTPHVTFTSTKSKKRKPKTAPMDLAWYKGLPDHIRRPSAVLLDQRDREPVMLLIYEGPDDNTKIVIELNTWVKKAGRRLNTIQSGRILTDNALVAELKHPSVELIDGLLKI